MHSVSLAAALVFASIFAGCAEAQSGPGTPDGSTELDAATFRAELAQGKALLLDVRTPAEYAAGHIPGSVNMDWSADDYEARFASLDPKQPLLIYCHSGGRSEQALEYLRSKGYATRHLVTGFAGWKNAGYPVEK